MHRCYGGHQEPTASAAVRHGAGESPTPLNLRTQTIVRIEVRPKFKSRLIGDLNPDEWELPPKPKWMRWSKYNRLVEKFDSYEEILNRGIAELMAKFLGKKI
jgi:hypothetical protein